MKRTKDVKMMIMLGVIILLFFALVIYMVYFQLFRADKLAAHDLNVRNSTDDTNLQRGSILSSDGTILTYSEKNTDGSFVRKNNYNYLYTTLIGYNSISYGKTGLERFYNNELVNNTFSKDIISKLENLYEKPTKGKDLYLTIDNNLQSYVYDLLGDQKGAVIVTEIETGKILAMVSKPSYNVNTIEEKWDQIIKSKDGNMLNRPTQGLYTPGSVFKLLTSIALIEENVDLNYVDKGSVKINGYEVFNFNYKTYGEMDLEKALEVSSNTYFAEKSLKVKSSKFEELLERFGINKKVNYDFIKKYRSDKIEDDMSDEDKAALSFGQGRNVLTPLDIHLITTGIANDGLIMKPYLVDKIYNKEKLEQVSKPEILVNDALSPSIAKRLRGYIKSTANYNGYTIDSVQVAGKTGTAEVNKDHNNAWYTGFAPADKPKYALTVVVEFTDKLGGEVAAPIGLSIFDYLYR